MTTTKTRKTALRVAFLPINQAWIVAWGMDGMIDIDNVKLWPERKDLVKALDAKGLTVARDGSISIATSTTN